MKQVLLFCTLLAVAFSARATDPLFQNFSSLYFNVPVSPPPIYDVTAFDNENVFSVSYEVYIANINFYQTRNTINYTNNGTMIANSPLSTNGFISSFGCGFNFDYWTTNVIQHQMAGTFYNPGEIRCNSTNDGNNIFNFGQFTFFFVNSFGECLVNATNVINPGKITVGSDGLIKLSAKYMDLSQGELNIESPLTSGILVGGNINTGQTPAGLTAVGGFGTDTNQDWNPAFYLRATNATSSLPFAFSLTNSTPFIDVANVNPTNVVVRAVFIQNGISSVPYQVYFGQPDPSLGFGRATVEWAGGYQDSASGLQLTNYLYLNNWYELGASTNVFINNGVPDNFTFTESTAPIPAGTVAASGFTTTFLPNNAITNPYSYVSAQLTSSSVSTNASGTNPSGAITNLFGRIQITASNELSLAGAQITGQNYMSLVAPNQFNGSQDAQIVAAYSDINLGVTNGNLDVANLLSPSVSTFNGSVVAWSTSWSTTDAGGVTTDYLVMIVSSDLSPLSKSWVQTLRLHATNSLVIHDTFNVYSSLYIDAKNLTVATNGYGNGNTSPQGELNWLPTITLNTVQFPNLLWLTNNGAIRGGNDAIFGTSAARYGAFINTGVVSDKGTAIWTTNFFNDGIISNSTGSFNLQTMNAVITNGLIQAGSDLTIATPSLVMSNAVLLAGRSLTLSVTNLLTDSGPGNGSAFTVGTAGTGTGLVLPVKPALGDLLGTTITDYAPGNKNIVNTWSGLDRGYSVAGYSNNAAVGRLYLDCLKGTTATTYGRLNFTGTGTSNAIYVDELVLLDYVSYTNRSGTNLLGLTFNTNLVIYYAQAVLADGTTVAEKINHFNTNRLRWIPGYAGYFSSTNLVYPPGVTNTVNAALAASAEIDSDGDGIPNASDATPFFTPALLNFTIAQTNNPAPKSVRLQWQTIPNSTNYIFYKTNLLQDWSPFTNFSHFYYGANVKVTNAAHVNWFPSPLTYPSNPPVSDFRTNVWVFDVITNTPHFYRVMVQPWLTYPN